MLISGVVGGIFLIWMLTHFLVHVRVHRLSDTLPTAYLAAARATSDDVASPRLIPLAIDLMRKERCTVVFDALTPAEKRMALYAYAVEKLPRWMTKLTLARLSGPEKAIFAQLRQIKTSRPVHKPMHFGAIHAQQQLRTASKT